MIRVSRWGTDIGGEPQGQRRAAGADENEFRAHGLRRAVGQVLDGDVPDAIRAALDVADFMAQVQTHAGVGQVLDHAAGQGAVIDVGTDVHAGRGHFLVLVAAVYDQRCPLADLRRVFAVQHALEQVLLLQGGIALAQVVDVVVAPDEGHMGNVVDEGTWITQVFLLHLIGPELLRNLELLVDFHGFLGFDMAVGCFRRVVQFSKAGMAGTGIIHRIRAFGANRIETLVHLNIQLGLQFLEHRAQGGTHDTGADQYHIDRLFRGRRRRFTA
jgi:hypothetical protein